LIKIKIQKQLLFNFNIFFYKSRAIVAADMIEAITDTKDIDRVHVLVHVLDQSLDHAVEAINTTEDVIRLVRVDHEADREAGVDPEDAAVITTKLPKKIIPRVDLSLEVGRNLAIVEKK